MCVRVCVCVCVCVCVYVCARTCVAEGGGSFSNSSISLLNDIFENASNDLNNETKADTPEKNLLVVRKREQEAENKTVAVISKLESSETYGQSIEKIESWKQRSVWVKI